MLEKTLRRTEPMRRTAGIAAAIALLLTAPVRLPASQANTGSGAASSSATNSTGGAPADTKPIGTRTVIDEDGRKVTVLAEVRRIVSLAPNLTEMMYALGLEDKLVGDTDYCDTPPAAKSKPHVGGPVNPSLEAIVGLHPDLVLATTSINHVETVDALQHLGIAVYTSDPESVEGMLASTWRMADLMGEGEIGAEVVGRLQARLDALKVRLADQPMVHVLFVVQTDPLITIGQNTFIADALKWAGAESVVISDQKWPHLSFEEVVRVQPEYIVLTPDHQESNAAGLADLRARNGWRDLDAVETGHVIVMSAAVNRPSPGMIDAIEQAARMLHPEAFEDDAEQKSAGPESKSQPAVTGATDTKPQKRDERECAACVH